MCESLELGRYYSVKMLMSPWHRISHMLS